MSPAQFSSTSNREKPAKETHEPRERSQRGEIPVLRTDVQPVDEALTGNGGDGERDGGKSERTSINIIRNRLCVGTDLTLSTRSLNRARTKWIPHYYEAENGLINQDQVLYIDGNFGRNRGAFTRLSGYW